MVRRQNSLRDNVALIGDKTDSQLINASKHTTSTHPRSAISLTVGNVLYASEIVELVLWAVWSVPCKCRFNCLGSQPDSRMPRFSLRNLLIGATWFFVWGTLVLNRNEILNASPLWSVPLLVSFSCFHSWQSAPFFGKPLDAIIGAFFLILIGLFFAGLLMTFPLF